VERGLLTRMRTSTPRRRIQSWTLHESMLHRLFKRRTLEVATAVMDNSNSNGQQSRSLRELAPVATPEACDALVRHLAPRMQWPLPDWTRLHRSKAPREFAPQVLVAAALIGVLAYHFGALGAALGALWLPWSAWLAWHDARHAGWAFDGATVAVRRGWWSRTWRMAEVGKLQALRVTRSPMDRWCGTATLLLDTAGGSAIGDPLQLRFLPLADAERLMALLSADVARRPLRW
jgi:putative membrane protein